MTDLITNNKAFPGTSVNVSTNLINIGLGSKVLMNAGIVNSIILGGWNRLFAGTSTVIQLGTKFNFNLVNSINVVFGNSWHYRNINKSIHDLELRFANNHLLISAGMNDIDLAYTSLNQQTQLKVVLTTTILYTFTLGISLAATLYPPFQRGGAINSEVQLSTNGQYIIMLETISVILVFLGQLYLTKKLVETKLSNRLASNLSLSAKGLNACLFYTPQQQPQLIKANNPANTLGYDYYSAGDSGYSMLGMLPGMPNRVNSYPNWRNPNHGTYPNHDLSPIITVGKKTTRQDLITKSYYLYSNLIDITTTSIILGCETFNTQPSSEIPEENFDSLDLNNNMPIENLPPGNSSKNRSCIHLNSYRQYVGIEYSEQDSNAASIVMNYEKTLISRNFGQSIAIVFSAKEQKPIMINQSKSASSNDNLQLKSEFEALLEETIFSVDHDDGSEDNPFSTSTPNDMQNIYSGLFLFPREAHLVTNNFQSGIHIHNETENASDNNVCINVITTIKNNNVCLAEFRNGITSIGDSTFSEQGVKFSNEFFVKTDDLSSEINEYLTIRRFHTKTGQTVDILKASLEYNLSQMKQAKQHIATMRGTLYEEESNNMGQTQTPTASSYEVI